MGVSKLLTPKLQWPTTVSAYRLIREIGIGSSSTVWYALCTQNENGNNKQAKVAVKIIDLETTDQSMESFGREVEIMTNSCFPNIMPIHCTFIEDGCSELWIVMPLCFSVKQLMKRMFPMKMDEEVIASTCFEVLKGLQYLHSQGIIHRDLKADNILISTKGEVFLADFGVSKKLRWNLGFRRRQGSFAGTPCFMCPEVISLEPYDMRADIWSFGVLCMQLANGHPPNYKKTPIQAMLATVKEQPPTHSCGSNNFRDMLTKSLIKDPLNRASSTTLLKCKFWTKRGKNQKRVLADLLKKYKVIPGDILVRKHPHRRASMPSNLSAIKNNDGSKKRNPLHAIETVINRKKKRLKNSASKLRRGSMKRFRKLTQNHKTKR